MARETVSGLHRTRLDAYAKFGLTRRWTLFVKPEVVIYATEPDLSGVDLQIGARRAMYVRGKFVVSGEVSFRRETSGFADAHCTTAVGREVRTGAAWSGKLRGQDTFMFAETALRFHKNCQLEYHDFGIGQTIGKNVQTITQLWIVRKGPDILSQKIQSELVWKGRFADYAIGYRQESSGRFVEDGVFVAIAKRF